MKSHRLSRRRFFQLTSAASTLGLTGAWSTLGRAVQDAGSSHKLVLVMLDGGWTSHLSCDPIVGSRRETGSFEEVYNSHDVRAPAGKDQLLTGLGFQPALPAFASMPTAFVNGMFVEIAAHDAASAFMLTGKQLIGRIVTEPSLPARLAARRGGLASHVVLGGSVPLGDTIEKAPPLQASGESLGELLSEPGDELSAATRDAMELALAQTDDLYFQSLGGKAQTSLEPFRASQRDLATVFDTFGGKLRLTDALRDRYGTKDDGDLASFPAALLALQYGLTSIVTIRVGGFDTHSNEINTQLPRQRVIATIVNSFVEDLRNTPDPHEAGRSLADNTTIVVTSEFTRTPRYNDTAGTDHQSTASAIVMGRGVRDNTIVGATDGDARPMGWDGTKAVTRTDQTMIDGSALVSSLLELFGAPEAAAAVGERRLRGLFT